jgi:hypothetical protein
VKLTEQKPVVQAKKPPIVPRIGIKKNNASTAPLPPAGNKDVVNDFFHNLLGKK